MGRVGIFPARLGMDNYLYATSENSDKNLKKKIGTFYQINLDQETSFVQIK